MTPCLISSVMCNVYTPSLLALRHRIFLMPLNHPDHLTVTGCYFTDILVRTVWRPYGTRN